MRAFLESPILRDPTIVKGLKLQGAAETLGAARTVVNDDPTILEFDAGGSSRNVTLPSRALVNDYTYRLIINHSTVGENLVVKDSDGTTRVTLGVGQVAMALAIGSPEAPGPAGTRSWRVYIVGGDDLAISDNLSVAGQLTGTSASFSDALVVSGGTSLNGPIQLGDSTADAIGFWNTAGVSQPSGTSQQAFSTTVPVSITASQYGYSTSTQIQSILNFLVEVRSAMVRTGFIKGS